MADEVYNLAVNFGVHPAKLFAFLLDLLGDFLAFSNGDGSHGRVSDPHYFRFLRHGRSPAWLFPTLLRMFFLALLFGFPALLFFGHSRLW